MLQGLRQQSVRDLTETAGSYESDWHALFDDAGIPAGPYNGRLLAWINAELGANYASLPAAQQAFAEANGALNWSSMGSFEAGFSPAFVTGSQPSAAQSWWSRDALLVSPDQRYVTFGYVDGTGEPLAVADQVVGEIDRSTGEIVDSFVLFSGNLRDDHNTPGGRFLVDGSLGYLYTGHDDDGVIRFRRSPTGRVGDLGSEVVVATTENTAYVQLFQDTVTGRLWAIWQTDDTQWSCAHSDNLGAAWTRDKDLFATSGLGTTDQGYNVWVQVAAQLLRGFVLGHPNNTQNSLYVLQFNLANGELSTASGVEGTVFDGTNDTALCAMSDMTAIVTPGASRSQRLFDVLHDGTGFITASFVTSTGATPALNIYTLADGQSAFTAGNWTLRNPFPGPGTPFYAASNYFAGACYDGGAANSVFIARHDNIWDGLHKIERYSTANAWANATLEELVHVSANRLVRPLSPTGITEGVGRLFYQEVTSYTDFTTWAIDLKYSPGTYVIVGRAIEAETQAFLDELDVQPSAIELDWLNEAVHYLKNGPASGGSVWANGEAFHISCWPTAQGSNLDLFNPTTHVASIVGSAPTHTPYVGWTYDTTDDNRDLGFNVNLAPQNAAIFMVGSGRSGTEADTMFGWSLGGGLSAVVINPRNATNNLVYRINTGTSSNLGSTTDGRGWIAAGRTGASAGWLRKNRAEVQTFSSTSTTPPDHNAHGGTASGSTFGAAVEWGVGLATYTSLNAHIDMENGLGILCARLRSLA